MVTLALFGTPLLAKPGAASGLTGSRVVISHVTATATKSGGDSAISLNLENDTHGPVSVLSITSTDALTSMIDYDVNMCQGHHAMAVLPNILIPSGSAQALGYTNQGAMLSGLRETLKVGESITLVVRWTNFNHVVSKTLTAKVVKPPKGIKFVMAAMGGMKM